MQLNMRSKKEQQKEADTPQTNGERKRRGNQTEEGRVRETGHSEIFLLFRVYRICIILSDEKGEKTWLARQHRVRV